MQSERLYARLEHFGTLRQSGRLYASLAYSTPICNILEHSTPVWSTLCSSGTLYASLKHRTPVWKTLRPSGTIRLAAGVDRSHHHRVDGCARHRRPLRRGTLAVQQATSKQTPRPAVRTRRGRRRLHLQPADVLRDEDRDAQERLYRGNGHRSCANTAEADNESKLPVLWYTSSACHMTLNRSVSCLATVSLPCEFSRSAVTSLFFFMW